MSYEPDHSAFAPSFAAMVDSQDVPLPRADDGGKPSGHRMAVE